MMLACATSAMHVILCIMKYHSVLPEAIIRRSHIQDFHKHKYKMYTKQAGMSYAQPQAEAVSLNSWLVFPPFRTLKRSVL
jgi:hypothetical protein